MYIVFILSHSGTKGRKNPCVHLRYNIKLYFAHQLLGSKDVELFTHSEGCCMEEQEMVPGSGCKVPQCQTCQRGLWATTIASTTLRNMAERLPCIQYFCVNITVGLLDSREVFCLLVLLFLTRLLLLMGWFILFRC